MKKRRMRAPSIVAALAGLAIVFAACSAAKPSSVVVFTTPTPVPSAAAPGTTAPVDSATPTPAPPTDTPAVGSQLPTATVVVPATPSPSPSPTRPAGGCSGTADTKSFFEGAANHLKLAIYCGAVPKGWHFSSATNSWPGVSKITATYSGPSGAKIVLKEGAFCTAGSSVCSPHDTYVGSAKFGDLSGGLYTLGPGLGYAIYVGAGTTHGYTATGTNVTQATFASIVGALYMVPKSTP